MKIKIEILFLVCAILLAACGGVTPYPISLAESPTFAIPTTKPLPTLTNTPTLTPIPWHTPTPETLYGYPTLQPAVLPTCNPIDCFKFEDNVQRQDFAFHNLYLGKYVLRNWCNIDPNFTIYPYCAVTISSKGNQQIEIWGYPARLGEETGADLTGRGKSDIVIVDWGGGNCCVGTIVYEVGDRLEKIMDIGSFRPGTFTDLNNDGSYEYIVPNRIFSQFCGVCQARPSVVYEYQLKLGYVPATYKFKDVLSADINKDLDFLAQFTKQNPEITFHFSDPFGNSVQSTDDIEFWNYANTNANYMSAVNVIYGLVIDYLLIGQQADAQNILNKYFPPDKATEYLSGIQKDLQRLLAQ